MGNDVTITAVRRVAADESYFRQLAQRLAHDARLPLALAVKRVKALAISAQIKNGFDSMGRRADHI